MGTITPCHSGNLSTQASKAVTATAGLSRVSARPLTVVNPIRTPVKEPGPQMTPKA